MPPTNAAIEPIQQDRSSLSRFFADMRRYPRLSKERERSVATNVRLGDTPALHELVQSNLAFVVKVASQYRNFGVPFEDLLNEGNVGLLEAAKRYDPTKDNKFVTYAIWWIRKSILQALTEQSVVRVPPYQMRRVREIQETESALQRALGRRPAREEVSERLERSVAKVDEVLQFATRSVSLDEKLGRDREVSLADLLVDDRASSPEDELLRLEAHQLVTDALRHLNKREREVILLRHGIADERPLTLQETGDRMRLSRERIRQIEGEAKERLRRFFARRLGCRDCRSI